jgi:hypothetical protein
MNIYSRGTQSLLLFGRAILREITAYLIYGAVWARFRFLLAGLALTAYRDGGTIPAWQEGFQEVARRGAAGHEEGGRDGSNAFGTRKSDGKARAMDQRPLVRGVLARLLP